jgi:hypothetical protein
MFYKVDFSTPLSRKLFDTLYERILLFGLECRDSEQGIKDAIGELVKGNSFLALLINLEGPIVTAHCLVKFNQLPDGTYEAFCSQLLVDSAKGDDFIHQCEAWASQFSGVSVFTLMTDERKYKAFRKKYDYQVHKVAMYKAVKHPEQDEDDG